MDRAGDVAYANGARRDSSPTDGAVVVNEGDVELILVANARVSSWDDFRELARWIHAEDPHVHVRVTGDRPADSVCEWVLPTLVVSFVPLRHMVAPRGVVLQGRHLPKSEEYLRLEAHGIRVPRWVQLRRGSSPALTGFAPHVVTKPDFGARGADVRIRSTARVAWRAPSTRQALELGGDDNPTLVQEFIYTGRWPVSHRVTSLLGEVLWSLRVEASHDRAPLADSGAFRNGGYSVVASGRGCTFEYCADEQILGLAPLVHAAFPDVPLLGIDVLRDAGSGALYVIEVNSLGFVWHFSTARGVALQQQFGLDLEAQFDGRRRAARRLARACRELAR